MENNLNSNKVKPVKAQSVQNPLCQLVKGIEKDNLNESKPSLEEKIEIKGKEKPSLEVEKEKIQDQPLEMESAKNCVEVSKILHSAINKVIKY